MKNRKCMILAAANTAIPVPAIAVIGLDAAANAALVEGRMTIPYGLHPVDIVNENGKPEKVLQRLDQAAAGRLVAAFNSFTGRLGRLVGGAAAYLGHPDYGAKAKTVAAWKRLGKCTRLEAGNEALSILSDLNDEGKALVAANAALAPSPHWGLARTGETQDGLAICVPVALYSIGLTPRPNIAGAAINEDPAEPEAGPMAEAADREKEAANLSAYVAQLEADCACAREACTVAQGQATDLAAQVAALTATIAERQARCSGLEADMQALRAELDACRTALEQSKAAMLAAGNSRAALVDAILTAANVAPADRPGWVEKLSQGVEPVADLVKRGALKTASVVPAQRIAAANDALGGVTAGARFEQAVRARMSSTGEDWPTAWNACRASHREIYVLMPNGGKA